ncbi:orotidine-5'-phosphate decarboxylase [Thioalkalivibrio sp. HK1]|uniref:orotidine-5'-phosphate decarboxylase n=1 Tax=Thioalkalivibrio sp. HK1 TaxID=1469245 RepID=UPI000471815E|nr:orotidine-5'-phosphate decarboxylase [Thioalkalivibrio sp. HK1]
MSEPRHRLDPRHHRLNDGQRRVEPRLIAALDFPSSSQALDLAARLDPARCRIKVGKELFTAAGPQVIERLHRLGFEIFLDLKFHDIPNTVAGACRAAAALGVWMINLHAAAGRRAMEAARDALDADRGGDSNPAPLLIGVTVLTSMAREDLRSVGIDAEPDLQVRRLASLAQNCGLDGVVCSGGDIARLQEGFRSDFLRVVPGVRPESSLSALAVDDQRRVMTPMAARRAGADYLVIGRPITAASDPMMALEAIERELALA